MDKAKLYVVSVPIGNMKDITLRAIETLQSVDFVIAEDTRQVGKLFQLLNLPRKQFISYREQNHDRIIGSIAMQISNGSNMALVTDRGTPTIADPGFRLIRDLLEKEIEIVSVPGPSSVIAALSVSGLPTDRFTFLGFLPREKGKQAKILSQFGELPSTFIIFESPFRIVKLVENILETLGDIDIALAHELTKQHESIIRGKASEVLEKMKKMKIKGEWILLGRKF